MITSEKKCRKSVKVTVKPEMTIKQFGRLPQLKEVAPYIVYSSKRQWKNIRKLTFAEAEKVYVTPQSMLDGAQKLIDSACSGEYFWQIYSQEEIKKERDKADVNIVRFSAEEKFVSKKKPFIILAAGGGYNMVSSLFEAYPTAVKFNQLGYTVFVLNYRVSQIGLYPKPIEDMATAVRFIINRATEMKVYTDKYILGGFSAGGQLVATFGTDNHGYKKYGLPKPVAMFPIYPIVNFELFRKNKEKERADNYLNILFGKDYTEKKVGEYNVDEHMSVDYPPCYIACCRDDKVVNYYNSIRLSERLNELDISNKLEVFDKGGHGFGDGQVCEAKNWILNADEFFRTL